MQLKWKHLLFTTRLVDSTPCYWITSTFKTEIRVRNSITADYCSFFYHHGDEHINIISAFEDYLSDVSFSQDSFNDFCENFGYDSDSIEAKDTYELMVAESVDCLRVLGDDWWQFREWIEEGVDDADVEVLNSLTESSSDDDYYLTI